ncbi:uncharacterized protein J7T54_008130 [Emericellopsis cladophorae]|uniref:Uncharacterized protein n=1 Tax=Emericellopsis cladophorae TaxID=2686198 RepID=A0A9P9Y7Q8_9HYPO|nr:uncharacterized protein J7T54_008130 [Emericellopsis cladophorae]KAI6785036.1 hypothetical protein J7T54_008130 [Emericellopsis cladophorae]
MVCLNEATFGPVVQGCRDDFDFTLRFEDIVLSIVPSCVFLAVSAGRLLWLVPRPSIAVLSMLLGTKLVSILVYVALQLSQLVLTARLRWDIASLSIPSEVLRLAVAIVVLLLSFGEHTRSPRPSILLGCFLFLTLLFDIVRARTIWLVAAQGDHYSSTVARVSVALTALKGVILLLEAQHKSFPKTWTDHHSGEETCGIFSLASYAWVGRLLLGGYRSVLSVQDLYPLDQAMSASTLEHKLQLSHGADSSTVPAGRLSRRMLKTLLPPLLTPVIPRLASIGFTFCQPLILESTLAHLQSPASAPSSGYGLIAATILSYTGIAVSNALYFYWQERYVTMVRGTLFTALYDKTVCLSAASAADSTVLTLMNSDIDRIKSGLLNIHEYWANTIELALACWLLQRKIGAAFVAPIVVVALCFVASGPVVKITGRRQMVWMKAIEERVTATAAMISAIKSLKMSGLGGALDSHIQGLREREIGVGNKWRLMVLLAATISFTPTLIGPLMALAVTSRTLNVTRIFPAMAYITLLATPLQGLFQHLPGLMSAIACLGRIDTYLEIESRTDPRSTPESRSTTSVSDKDGKDAPEPALQVTCGHFGWAKDKYTLENVNLSVPSSSLAIVIGPVAAGKSTLLKALLGETTSHSGTVALGASLRTVGYCDQTPFLLNDTIRGNIVGHAPFDQDRYREVLHAASLGPDLKQLPQGDLTSVGSSGHSLSGGQKQRLALARALYLDAHLFLLDDVLSGLDASTSSLVFQRALGPRGLLARRNATVVLCTHDEKYLPFADTILAISSQGLVTCHTSLQELVAAGHLKLQGGTKVLTYDGAPEELKNEMDAQGAEQGQRTATKIDKEEMDGSRQVGDFTVYRHYLSSMATWTIILFVLVSAIYGFTIHFSTVWLKYWSADVVRPSPSRSGAFYVGIYALLQGGGLLSLAVVVYLCTQPIISHSGSTLHRRALRTVLAAPLRFFALVDAGTITNLFAQDLTLIDSELPLALLNFTAAVFSLIGAAAVIATASPWLAVAYPPLLCLVYYIQLFYLRTSRQLRLLDLEAKAPLYAHFMETLSGLVTLRALGFTRTASATSNRLLDTSQRPAYLLAIIQRWLQFVLRIVVMLLATIVVTLATQLRTDAGLTGATLLTLMGFGTILSVIVESYTTLETSIGAVARLKTFSDATEAEPQPHVDAPLDMAWPPNGLVEIERVTASYSGQVSPDEDAVALRDVSVTFQVGERTAVVGRTGSGKSSLVLLILRLLDPVPSSSHAAGRILIDGLPIDQVQRETLRRRIIAISQDPAFLPPCSTSTLRDNLDPFREARDEDIQATLASLGLGFLADGQETADHKSTALSDAFTETSLSQGQKQLFNLARAVLRQRVRKRNGAAGGLVLLDEASSSVDTGTQEHIWNTIHSEFQGCTVIMIVHRLDLATRCDRVIVMEHGRVAETGRPEELRTREGGHFRSLLESRDM